MRQLLLLLSASVTIVVIAITACGGGSDDGRAYVEPLYPIREGNYWEYDMVRLQTILYSIDTFTITYYGTAKDTITQKTMLINSQEVYEKVSTEIWDDTLATPNRCDTTYVAQIGSDDEYFYLAYENLNDTIGDTLFRQEFDDPAVGFSWIIRAEPGDTITATYLDKLSTTVPCFPNPVLADLYRFVYTSPVQTRYSYFRSNYGLVKDSLVTETPNIERNSYVKELVESYVHSELLWF